MFYSTAGSVVDRLFAVYTRSAIKMPRVGQTEQPLSKDLLLVEIESLRKQNEMNRVPVSSALQMLVL